MNTPKLFIVLLHSCFFYIYFVLSFIFYWLEFVRKKSSVSDCEQTLNTQRSGLMKSILNLLKRLCLDAEWGDIVHSVMDGNLPSVLRQIFLNGSTHFTPHLSLFAMETITNYLYTYPSRISTMQVHKLICMIFMLCKLSTHTRFLQIIARDLSYLLIYYVLFINKMYRVGNLNMFYPFCSCDYRCVYNSSIFLKWVVKAKKWSVYDMAHQNERYLNEVPRILKISDVCFDSE